MSGFYSSYFILVEQYLKGEYISEDEALFMRNIEIVFGISETEADDYRRKLINEALDLYKELKIRNVEVLMTLGNEK